MKKKLKMSLLFMVLLGLVGYALGVALAYVTDAQSSALADAFRSEFSFIFLAVGAATSRIVAMSFL